MISSEKLQSADKASIYWQTIVRKEAEKRATSEGSKETETAKAAEDEKDRDPEARPPPTKETQFSIPFYLSSTFPREAEQGVLVSFIPAEE